MIQYNINNIIRLIRHYKPFVNRCRTFDHNEMSHIPELRRKEIRVNFSKTLAQPDEIDRKMNK